AKAGADGVIIGSKIVGIIEENLRNKGTCINEIAAFIKNVKAAIAKQS
ncbi:MAG: tryptophan synthase subunit alpha, partial [Sedimentisphaerales bacterium]|nr:tryptophan synthase subunit alpha [Sedimentisphaerales bacterium]